jgi:hypothetical protein
MKNETAVQHSSAEGQADRREWVKPEAKSADVAQATLTGHISPPITDFITCNS